MTQITMFIPDKIIVRESGTLFFRKGESTIDIFMNRYNLMDLQKQIEAFLTKSESE